MPFPYSIADFCNAIPDVLRDEADKLIPSGNREDLVAAYTPFVKRAILQRYSPDAPLEVVSDVVGNGTPYLDLPVAPAVEGETSPIFEPEFSVVKQIEFPIGQQPPQLVLDSYIRVYRSPSGWKLLLGFDSPSADESIRVTWTARHAADGTTVPDLHFYAVVDYAASIAAETLATIYAQTGDASMSADVVNYRTKSQEYASIAKLLRKRYYNMLGIDEGSTTGASESAPAIAMGNQYLEMASGVDRLVHGRGTR